MLMQLDYTYISLRENKKRDAIKNQFCIDNFIKILRIKYDKIDMLTLEYLNRRIKTAKYLKVNTMDNLIAGLGQTIIRIAL